MAWTKAVFLDVYRIFHNQFLPVRDRAEPSARFHDATTALSIRLRQAGLGMHAAQQQALARMYALVQSQAAVLFYVEVYWMLAMASTIMFASSFLLKRNEPEKRENVSVH